ncbi:MAG TPA: DUF1565 domain-containing protein, partial [Patescibacteria group bacterium]|nr:DUF1565 domain-containing protein [Patescibacteria group bacterium]
MHKNHTIVLSLVILVSATAPGKELFVAPYGKDSNVGTSRAPLRTIQRGAELAQPGDTITVRAGVYRERITPPRGGTSDKRRIIYQAAKNERVELKGSEVITNWAKVQDNVWKATIPNSFFGHFNPYEDLIHGDWFDPKGRLHHTGAVYLNGEWLVEATTIEEVLAPEGSQPAWLRGWQQPEKPALWFAKVDETNTTIWAQFGNLNPNQQLVEINVRQSIFYPNKPGRNYIT